MKRHMLKSKIHGATITDKRLDYQGSITIDAGLLRKADILPGEQVHVLNLDNGNRFVTYAIEAKKGSGTVMLNGPAAHLGNAGEKVVVLAYCDCTEAQARKLRPRIIVVDRKNRPKPA